MAALGGIWEEFLGPSREEEEEAQKTKSTTIDPGYLLGLVRQVMISLPSHSCS
jgi:hypothetical protein